MAQPTINDLFDNNTTLITSAAWNEGTRTLSVAFGQSVTPIQAFGAIVQSGHKWLEENEDLAVNADATAASTFSTSRNGVQKNQYSLGLLFFAPLPEVTYDPTQL